MTQNLVADANTRQSTSLVSRQAEHQQHEAQEYTLPFKQTRRVGGSSILAALLSTLLLRVASRVSFVLLGFYLGEHVASATVVALVLEAFYISELVLAPLVGSLSDHLGRKPFLLLAPAVGGVAALSFFVATLLFPPPNANRVDLQLGVLLVLVLVGRLLEGAMTALNAPATLGYIADATAASQKLRVRVMTAFEVVTVGGLALAIPFGGKISSLLGTWGFFVVIALHCINIGVLLGFLKESLHREVRPEGQHSLLESLRLLRFKRIFTFLPAWLSINALVGAWITLITIMLAYPNPAADVRFPGQLLYGGFSKEVATLLLGGFGLVFLGGMGVWMLIVPRLRRTTVMLLGLGGLGVSIIALTFINGLAENMATLPAHSMLQLLLLLALVLIGVFLLSGFTPVALTHIAEISETMQGKRGAVMGLYSVVLGLGQLLGALLGGLCVDIDGFYGLMGFSVGMGVLSLASVVYMRFHSHDVMAKTTV
jgi:MFS family permease